MALNDVMEAVVSARVKGEYVQNVFHLKETTASTDPIPAKALAEAIQAVWLPDWAALVSTDVEFACCYVRRIKPAPGVAYTLLLTNVGAVASDAVPTGSALIVTWYSGLASKRGRGRTYFAGLPEEAQDAGLLAAAVVGDWEDLADLIATILVAQGGGVGAWELGVYSEVNAAIADTIARSVRTNLGSMRSRRQRPGTS